MLTRVILLLVFISNISLAMEYTLTSSAKNLRKRQNKVDQIIHENADNAAEDNLKGNANIAYQHEFNPILIRKIAQNFLKEINKLPLTEINNMIENFFSCSIVHPQTNKYFHFLSEEEKKVMEVLYANPFEYKELYEEIKISLTSLASFHKQNLSRYSAKQQTIIALSFIFMGALLLPALKMTTTIIIPALFLGFILALGWIDILNYGLSSLVEIPYSPSPFYISPPIVKQLNKLLDHYFIEFKDNCGESVILLCLAAATYKIYNHYATCHNLRKLKLEQTEQFLDTINIRNEQLSSFKQKIEQK